MIKYPQTEIKQHCVFWDQENACWFRFHRQRCSRRDVFLFVWREKQKIVNWFRIEFFFLYCTYESSFSNKMIACVHEFHSLVRLKKRKTRGLFVLLQHRDCSSSARKAELREYLLKVGENVCGWLKNKTFSNLQIDLGPDKN